jgi:hypothetical protein
MGMDHSSTRRAILRGRTFTMRKLRRLTVIVSLLLVTAIGFVVPVAPRKEGD